MIVSIAAAIVAAQFVAAADKVPNLNLEPTCSAARSAGVFLERTKDACLRSEHKARDQLHGQWAQFHPADRNRCTQSTSAGGVPSYVELLTCLEIAKLARDLPDETVGRAPSNR
jgi:hypothetical protein